MENAPIPDAPLDPTQRRLDEWYLTLSKIYVGRNFHRSASSLFAHLVETCGGMSRHARSDWVPVKPDSTPKALAWWFALLAKVGVRSAEDILWTKYPGVCPYCLLRSHEAEACEFERRQILATKGELVPDWAQLKEYAAANVATRPVTLPDFVQMFLDIYGQPTMGFGEAFSRLGEELGELAEAVRVVQIAPHYFVAEAPDVFAWMVQCYSLIAPEGQRSSQQLATDLWASYPDACADCGRDPCTCPPVRRTTLGRLAVSGPAFEAHFGPGGMFLPLDEMLRAIDTGAGTLQVGDAEYRFDAREVKGLLETIAAISSKLDNLASQNVVQLDQFRDVHQKLETLGARLEAIWMGEEINGARLVEVGAALQALREWVDAQPGPARQQILAVISGLASGGLLRAILGA